MTKVYPGMSKRAASIMKLKVLAMSSEQVDEAIAAYFKDHNDRVSGVGEPFQPSSFWSDCLYVSMRPWSGISAVSLALQTERFTRWLGVSMLGDEWAYYASRFILLRLRGVDPKEIGL